MTAPIKRHVFSRDRIVYDLRKQTIEYMATRSEKHPIIDGKKVMFGCYHNAEISGNDVTVIRKINGVKTVEIFPDELDASIERGKAELLHEYAVHYFQSENTSENQLEYYREILKEFGLENEMKDHEKLADDACRQHEVFSRNLVNAFVAYRGVFGSRID